ncbi:prepilin-type N-terminal cleavage/methylation domain-containing protein [Candidatus Daviesbacteria bacterium]|nr:prepilin-type N-terminal cleavage/methylation domain-containing protein [Candidatus Daviesbacteria bacterium]
MPKLKLGYTLIELLITVTIIVILVGLGIVLYRNIFNKTKQTKIIVDMEAVGTAANLYEKTTEKFPADVGGGSAPAIVPQYLKEWPTSPCAPNIVYDWESWLSWGESSSTWTPIVRISLRRVKLSDGSPDDTTIYYACVQPNKNGSCTCNDYTPTFPDQHFCKGYAPIEDAPKDLKCDYMMDTTRFPSYGHF